MLAEELFYQDKFTQALEIYNRIIASSHEGLHFEAEKKKSLAEKEIDKHSRYERIRASVEKNNLDTARPVWRSFKLDYPGYDPDNLDREFAAQILDSQSRDRLKRNVSNLFADDE